jgi:hypothetical protein
LPFALEDTEAALSLLARVSSSEVEEKREEEEEEEGA